MLPCDHFLGLANTILLYSGDVAHAVVVVIHDEVTVGVVFLWQHFDTYSITLWLSHAVIL